MFLGPVQVSQSRLRQQALRQVTASYLHNYLSVESIVRVCSIQKYLQVITEFPQFDYNNCK